METHRAGMAAEGRMWSKRQHRNIPLPQPALCSRGLWHCSAQAVAVLTVPTASPAECRAPRGLGHAAC